MKHLQIRVFGKVQGVWFRKSTELEAKKLGVVGIVMNEPDGSVYIEAEGGPAVLEDFVAYCKQGPVQAKVEKILLSEGALKNFVDFRIIH